jgi:glycosyltransferase involved in cell wall biosynthesis
VTLSVVIISHNEEANIGRTLKSVMPLVRDGKGEIILVDSGSTDRTIEIAKSFGAKVFIEDWKGYAAQKNSAIDKATGDWILSLDADEELGEDAGRFIDVNFEETLSRFNFDGVLFHRQNHFLGKWVRHGGFYPDPKLRLFRRGCGRFEDRLVHEDVRLLHGKNIFDPNIEFDERTDFYILHHSYPTFSDYISHMNRYSSLGAEMVVAKGKQHFLFSDIVFRPLLTFTYNYFFRLGFLDGHEGLLLHVGHAVYVSWKYMKVWELQHSKK